VGPVTPPAIPRRFCFVGQVTLWGRRPHRPRRFCFVGPVTPPAIPPAFLSAGGVTRPTDNAPRGYPLLWGRWFSVGPVVLCGAGDPTGHPTGFSFGG